VYEIFKETDLPSFKKMLNLILEISSNVDDDNENLICKKKFLDFGAGKYLKNNSIFQGIFYFVQILLVHTDLKKFVGLSYKKICAKKELR
jgi:hypothetical protein